MKRVSPRTTITYILSLITLVVAFIPMPDIARGYAIACVSCVILIMLAVSLWQKKLRFLQCALILCTVGFSIYAAIANYWSLHVHKISESTHLEASYHSILVYQNQWGVMPLQLDNMLSSNPGQEYYYCSTRIVDRNSSALIMAEIAEARDGTRCVLYSNGIVRSLSREELASELLQPQNQTFAAGFKKAMTRSVDMSK